ncbi:gamma-glutamyltransferase family protein [Methylovirgula sp. 4M-Z18]|uniref:gamma-glutamyltransferase family protein n=1 Tax=Methylovirgula sp. 4M-Z18 TaxID=2293567 RepID=UPI000E2FD394|nr:gamma-glutamyltransferase family protein [Methylovirgula sp. 4M-Z18]RFB78101.1 gamma-glutamyltransferase family protein [Methylovirgula sp. 4M-Z18]
MTDTHTFGKAAVAAPHRLASEAGLAILQEGGNALEAMVAMAATIAVVYPHMNGIGGDAFWLIHAPGSKVHYIEACGPAGALATVERYRKLELDRIPVRGPHAALTVPGAIGGWIQALDMAQARGGRLPLKDLLSHAAEQARKGCPVSPSEARYPTDEWESLVSAPGFRETFLIDGKVPDAGTVRHYPALGATLDQLAHAGLADFYRGDVARELAADLEKIGSAVTREDLRRYEACWRAPLTLRQKDISLYNSPPPTQGLASLILLGIFARLKKDGGPDSFAHTHGLIEATKRAYAIRDRVCIDFAHLVEDPKSLLTADSLGQEAEMIDMSRTASVPVRPHKGDTIWMGAIGADGLAVSYIQSIYWEYGSGCVLPRTGVLMQNRGMSFSLDPQALNTLRPGRRPFHTLNPPLALCDDGRVISYGSMGGDGQPQFQAQILSRYLSGTNVAAALDAPRFLYGRTWGADSFSVKLESRFESGVARALARAGHEIEYSPHAYADMFGHAGMLVRHPNGRIDAAHDPRADGTALGL